MPPSSPDPRHASESELANRVTAYFYSHHLRIKDYPRWAEQLTKGVRENMEQIAKRAGIDIEFVRTPKLRKETLVRQRIRERGDHPGLVCILSAMERCSTYKPHWRQGPPRLVPAQSKCLHYYAYFIDEELGLCSIRVPTWPPFQVQIYFNGHGWLTRQLNAKGIAYGLIDNAFVSIADFAEAQKTADQCSVGLLYRKCDALAAMRCPVTAKLASRFQSSINQAEYSTDIVFSSREALQPLYTNLARTVVHAAKADDIATFLGKKIRCDTRHEVGTRYDERIDGVRVRHSMGPRPSRCTTSSDTYYASKPPSTRCRFCPSTAPCGSEMANSSTDGPQ